MEKRYLVNSWKFALVVATVVTGVSTYCITSLLMREYDKVCEGVQKKVSFDYSVRMPSNNGSVEYVTCKCECPEVTEVLK